MLCPGRRVQIDHSGCAAAAAAALGVMPRAATIMLRPLWFLGRISSHDDGLDLAEQGVPLPVLVGPHQLEAEGEKASQTKEGPAKASDLVGL